MGWWNERRERRRDEEARQQALRDEISAIYARGGPEAEQLHHDLGGMERQQMEAIAPMVEAPVLIAKYAVPAALGAGLLAGIIVWVAKALGA